MIKQHKTHLVWDSDGWMDIEKDKYWLDFVKEEYPDIYEDKDALSDFAHEQNLDYLSCERDNLDYPCTLIAMGSVGLWNRSVEGYCLGDNLNECFDMYGVDCDYSCRIYVDGVTLKGDFYHHDCPTGYTLTFYVLKDDVSDSFRELLDNHEPISESQRKKYLRSAGRIVKKIYGF